MGFIKANSKAIAARVVALLGVVGVNVLTEVHIPVLELGIVGVWIAPANA